MTKITLQEYLKDCDNLQQVFEKAKREERVFHIIELDTRNSFKIIDAKKDYVILKQKDEEQIIHPYGSNLEYYF